MDGSLLHHAARVFVVPRAEVRDAADRRRAELLAALLLALLGLGLCSGLVQLAFVPRFVDTFISMLAALAVIALAYCASRTRFFRAAVWVACLAPVGACFAILVTNPEDTVAASFMLLGVLLASTFLDARATLAIAGTAFVALAAALVLESGPFQPRRALPLLAYHAVLSPLFVISTVHRDALERLRQAESRRREAALHEQRQLELLGRLAGNVAHDFNNLLLVVQANAELLARLHQPHTLDLTADIRAAAIRGAGLTRQLLAAARKQQLEPERVSVNALLASMEGLLRRLLGGHITLVVEPADADLGVMADRSQLEQVVLNLALNGRDAMPNGGLLRLEARRRMPKTPPNAAAHWLCLSVSDTGVGMDAAALERIGEPFFSTKGASGHGLGLAMVKGIVEQSGGRLEVISAPGQGSRFDVFLPLTNSAPQAAPALQRSAELAPASAQKATILVLDDDEAVLRAVTHVLADMGHHVLAAQSAGEAIALFEREHGRIDLLVCDLVVSAIHGVDVATLLVRRLPRLRVLFMSAYADSRLEASMAIPSAELIAKPFSIDDLGIKVQRTLSAAPASQLGAAAQPALG
jgi:two-component system, cell cycle sensor histidine kinase and response regulator CckA